MTVVSRMQARALSLRLLHRYIKFPFCNLGVEIKIHVIFFLLHENSFDFLEWFCATAEPGIIADNQFLVEVYIIFLFI